MRRRPTLLATLLVLVAACAGTTPHAAAAPVFAPGRIVETVGFTNAFGEAAAQIWTMAPDGSDRRVVVADPTVDATGAVADPAGRRIAFTVDGGSTLRPGGLYVTTLDGLDTTDLLARHAGVIRDAGNPTWSPDGTRLAFVGYDTDLAPDFWLVQADGTGLKRITHCGCAYVETPRWSPVRDTLLWSPDQDDLASLVIRSGIDRTLYDGHPSGAELTGYDWSPTGNRVVFASRGPGDATDDLFTVPLTGGTPTRLTAETSVDLTDPHFSPDGSQLVTSASGPADDPGLADVRVLTRAGRFDSPAVTVHGPDDEHATDWAAPCASDCPSAGTRSLLSAAARVTDGGIVATGGLVPGLSGAPVSVALQHKVGTVWRTLATVTAPTDDHATYRASFAEPVPGSCRVTASWAGDAGHDAATAVSTPFSC